MFALFVLLLSGITVLHCLLFSVCKLIFYIYFVQFSSGFILIPFTPSWLEAEVVNT